MATILWDNVGERIFYSGVDRGVLYLNNGQAFPWNGLVSVEDGSDREVKSYYMDGVKYLTQITPGDFSGKLKAFTYPAEFDQVNGVELVAPGLAYHDQRSDSFGLSYRTGIGNDVEGSDYGYKIHLFYNLVADEDAVTYETITDSSKPSEFSWALTGTPEKINGHRPTVHISIDSTAFDPNALAAIEDILYGTETTLPRLPSLDEINQFIELAGTLLIIDNGDGTWTAIDVANEYITMLDPTTFQIDNADATYLDATTYEISTTNPE